MPWGRSVLLFPLACVRAGGVLHGRSQHPNNSTSRLIMQPLRICCTRQEQQANKHNRNRSIGLALSPLLDDTLCICNVNTLHVEGVNVQVNVLYHELLLRFSYSSPNKRELLRNKVVGCPPTSKNAMGLLQVNQCKSKS